MPCEALSAPSTATIVEANAKTYKTSTLLITTHLYDLLKETIPELVGHQHAHLAAGVAIAVANALHLVETSDERIEKREKTRSAARRGSESRGTRRPRGSDSRSFRSRSCGPTLESESTSKRRS